MTKITPLLIKNRFLISYCSFSTSSIKSIISLALFFSASKLILFLLENNLFFLEKWKEIGFGEDYDFNERVVASTEDIYITNDVIYGYH